VLCSWPGCAAILDQPGRCTEHRRPGWDEWKARGGSRGYDTPEWKRLRRAYLDEHPVCERCPAPAAQVHHRDHAKHGDPSFFAWANLEALCLPCHRSETAGFAGLRKQGRV
jgi:5-methylcytosine-specific restriction protein A